MKVALISFHNAYNYGAVLQAYSLQEAVSLLGYDCEYIDYQNKARKHSYNTIEQAKKTWKNGNKKRALKLLIGTPLMSLRKKNFNEFLKTRIRRTAEVYHSSEEAARLNSQYDKFIVGSDQVWNLKHNGKDMAYFLDFINDDDKKISYASSFGMLKVLDEKLSEYKEALNSIEYLSTREMSGVNLIKEITGRDAHLVLDPVFLTDAQQWKSLIPIRKNKKPYVFFYTNRSHQIKDFYDIGKEYKNFESHVLSTHMGIKDLLNPKVHSRSTISPEEFLWEINNATLVVTASFHCLVFSIIFRKPFIAILTGDKGKDERLLNLLEITGLTSRILTDEMKKEEISLDIDWENVYMRLKPYLEHSKKFLKLSLESKKIETMPVLDSEMKSYSICDENECTGCGACAQICAQNAIMMLEDEEGFLRPCITEERCVECGVCNQICPANKIKEKTDYKQQYFAIKNTDDIRKLSSSGGVFTAMSDVVLEKNGYVIAPIMDDKFNVYHTVARNKSERDQMRNTFYVQSNTTQIYSLTKKYLNEGRMILFVGTPCQIAGLYAFLGKENDRLYTVDLICHGVPSPAIFKKYIEYISNKKGEVSEFRFRDKTLGWGGYTVSTKVNGKTVTNKQWLQSYNCLFSKNYINRKSCSICKYTNYDRVADVTIGDFWSIKKVDASFYDKKGVSVVLVNSKKGENLLKECKDIVTYAVDREQTIQNSLKKPAKANSKRNECIKMIMTGNYEKASSLYGENSIKGYLKNFARKIWLKVK